MIPLWALVHYEPLYALCALLAPSVVCKNITSLDLIWFPLIDGVISLVMCKKRVCLSKKFQML
jgi:hypothetical protein